MSFGTTATIEVPAVLGADTRVVDSSRGCVGVDWAKSAVRGPDASAVAMLRAWLMEDVADAIAKDVPFRFGGPSTVRQWPIVWHSDSASIYTPEYQGSDNSI